MIFTREPAAALDKGQRAGQSRRGCNLDQWMTRVGDPPSKRILLVEDEPFVALSLSDLLSELGFDVSCVSDVDAALEVIERERLDGALLDVHIGSERIDPVADRLAARSCPFIFTTGLGDEDIPPAYAHHAILQKPFGAADLVPMLDSIFGR